MRFAHLGAVGAVAFALAPVSSANAQIAWTSWTTATQGATSGSAAGTAGSTNVNYSGEVESNTQLNGTGSPVWDNDYTPPAFGTDGPTTTDFIALYGGSSTGTNTLTFSSPMDNVFLAIWSLGASGAPAEFDFTQPFTIVSQGADAYGGSSMSLTESGNTLSGQEGSGIIEFNGPISSLSWTNPTYEGFYGFTAGAMSSGTSTVPEPSSMALLGTGLFGLAPFVRRRRR